MQGSADYSWDRSVVAAGVMVVLVLAAALASLAARTGAVPVAAAFVRGPDTVPMEPPALDLVSRLDAAGFDLPPRTSVYAARVVTGPAGSLTMVEFEAGGGGRADDFWPASSIKVMVALGALDFLKSLGFSGAATVEAESGWTETVRGLIEASLDESDNYSYDRLVQIAGLDRLNNTFLSAANGFPQTVIQRSYSGIDVRTSPQMTITEGGRSLTVPARVSETDYGCPDNGNCSNLYEMADSVRRVVLAEEIPSTQRFAVDRADLRVIADALLASEGWVEPGVVRALGRRALVYNKPGAASGRDCLDVGLVDDRAGNRFVFAISAPLSSPGGCTVLASVAEVVLRSLAK